MTRTGIGFDAHRLVTGRRLVLGGVEILHAQGLLGHSDADVLTHALMDALLGAVADGDIGRHFPDKDPRWKDADSLDLLRQVVARVRDLGWQVGNVDVTVLAEAPRLAPYVARMCERLAAAMNVATGQVSVKATTVEGMGAIGRREGISAMAVATVESMGVGLPGLETKGSVLPLARPVGLQGKNRRISNNQPQNVEGGSQ
jgi:2-C-methyl-D-erythritol 2,4-cyclodiphosphate synthase